MALSWFSFQEQKMVKNKSFLHSLLEKMSNLAVTICPKALGVYGKECKGNRADALAI